MRALSPTSRWNLLVVAVLCVNTGTGCNENQCSPYDETRCVGSQLQVCLLYDDSDTFLGGTYLAWEPFYGGAIPASGSCPDYCVEADGQANCSMTSAPIPECARDGNACWQGSPVECLGGFPLDYGAFAPCEVDAGETCVNASCVPLADSGAD